VTPAVIDSSRKGDVHKGAPLGTFWFFQKRHPCLMRQTVSLACVAGNAGADDILPSRLTTPVTRKDVIDVEIAPIKVFAAVLAGVLVPVEDVESRELDLLFRQAVKQGEDDDSRNPDFQRDGLQHPWLGIAERKVPPAGKIVREKIHFTVGRDGPRVSLIEEGKGAACGTGVDGLPQPVEYKYRTIERMIHDIVSVVGHIKC